MENKVAVMAIIVEDTGAADELNPVLHDFASCIIGRMGLPYREKKINIISIALDAPEDTISSLAGRIGSIKGVSVKTVIANT